MNRSVSTMSGRTKMKIILLGDQSVGKSCVIERYISDKFQQTSNPTVGIDFLVKNLMYNAKSYRLQLWDTAGQQRFRSLIPNYLKDAKAALILFDVSNKASLNNVESWIKMYNENRTVEGRIVLIGNKIDLEYRQITYEEGKKKADELKVPYYEISAKTGENIESLFYKILDLIEDGCANFEHTDKPEVIKQQQNAQEQDAQVRQQQQDSEPIQSKKEPQKKQRGKASSEKIEEKGNIVLKKDNKQAGNQNQKQKNKKQCC